MKRFPALCFFLLFLISCDDARDGEYHGLHLNADSAVNDFKKGNCRIITYGSDAASLANSSTDSLARSFGFYYSYQGQHVPANFSEGFDAYNKAMDSLLASRNGDGWEGHFAQLLKKLNNK